MKKKYNVTWPSFVFLPAIFVGWTIINVQALTRLQHGEKVLVWWFTALTYEILGYWFTLLLPPVLGILCLAGLILIYRNERRDR